jgi:hypothetical protein
LRCLLVRRGGGWGWCRGLGSGGDWRESESEVWGVVVC